MRKSRGQGFTSWGKCVFAMVLLENGETSILGKNSSIFKHWALQTERLTEQ